MLLFIGGLVRLLLSPKMDGAWLILIAVVIEYIVRIEARFGEAIDSVPLTAKEVGGRAVLFQTGWDRYWRTDAYFEGHPHLTERAAEWLANAGAALVGIDTMNIDSIATGKRPVHSILLGHDIPIVEHLCGLGRGVGDWRDAR